MPAGILLEEETETPTQMGANLFRGANRLNAKRVFVADHEPEWQKFYRDSLERIVGRGNIDVVSSCSEGSDMLQGKIYSAYVIEPTLPSGSESNGNGYWGFELVAVIMCRNANISHDLFWVLSSNQYLLLKAEENGFKNLYTKDAPEKCQIYPNRESFIRKISDSLK